MVAILSSFSGPTADIPFGNGVHYTIAVAFFLLGRNFVNDSGFLHTHCPPEPRKSYYPVFFKCAVTSARLMDCFTDLAFIRVLLDEVCST